MKEKQNPDSLGLKEGLYKGKRLKDMTRQELYEAIYNFDCLYRIELNREN